MRIRQGNDFIFLWAIERNGEPENFSNAVNIRLHFKNYDCVGEVESFQIVDGNIVRVEVTPEWASRLGAYRLILSYEFENNSYSDGDQKCVVDVLAFNIVPKTSEADDVTEMAKTTDIMIGLKGDKGDPFTYDDFTPEQIDDLKRPAVEAAESILIVENQVQLNEQGRVQAENEREIAEATRVSNENNRVAAEQARVDAENLRATAESSRELAESLRVEAELLRQSNTQEAISNAENATENANTAAQNADNARLAIQDDLALKANHGYASIEVAKTLKEVDDEKANHGYASIEVAKTLKQVEDNASVKIKNEAVNGNFENGSTAPFSKIDGDGGESTLAINSTTPISGNYDVRFTITTPSTANGRPIFTGLHRAANIGDKIYLHFYAKILSGTPSIHSMQNGATNSMRYRGDVVNGRNTRIIDVMGTRDDLGLIYFNSTSVWDMQMDNFMRINLTKTFGAGNEPTEEEMNLLLDIAGISYIDDEVIIPAQKVMQWQLALIRKNKNAIIALGGTII